MPSPLYSYSYELNPSWTRLFAPQQEIWDYLRMCARKYGVDTHVRYGCAVDRMDWDEEAGCWHIATGSGGYLARAVVSAGGALHLPSYPDIPGRTAFSGTAFHSVRWDHGADLTGKQVAVIGTGASAIQFIPEIADRPARLRVFQRSAPWLHPRPDTAIPARVRGTLAAAPLAARAVRDAIYWGLEARALGFAVHPRLMAPLAALARQHLSHQVADPDLRAKLTPDYTIGCKRILLSSSYYPALQRPNVDLITDRITEITPAGLVTEDGTVHPAGVIIYATGFKVVESVTALNVTGRDGRQLAAAGLDAYHGITVPGFPNFFMVPEHRPGPHLSRVHGREPDPAHHELPADPGPGQGGHHGGQPGGGGPVQHRAAAAAAPGGVERGRVHQLVPRPGRDQPGAVAGILLRVLGPDAPRPPRRLRGHRAGRSGRVLGSTTNSRLRQTRRRKRTWSARREPARSRRAPRALVTAVVKVRSWGNVFVETKINPA